MKIDYTTKFSAKRKTLGLIVERDKSVVVMVPDGTSEEVISEFVFRRKNWLYQKLNFTPKLAPQPEPAPFVSGKAIMYLGKNYKLDLVDKDFEGVHFNGKFYVSRKNQEIGTDLLNGWYKQKAQEKIIAIVERFSKRLGVSYKRVFISHLRYSWGSCSPHNNLNFNWNLIKTPTFVIEYIVIHELAHLIELNHTPRFWNIVKIQMPNYEQAKDWLKVNGARVLG